MRFTIIPPQVAFVPEVSLVIPQVGQTIIATVLLMEPSHLWCVSMKVLANAAHMVIIPNGLISMVLR